MNLKKMLDFKPNAEDMAMLPLDVVVWIKVSVVSLYKEDNYDFIRYLFTDDLIKDYIKDIQNTVIYDFDGTQTKQSRFVTVFECCGLRNYQLISGYLEEVMEGYDHKADVLMDIYTHDDHEYRLSNLDGIVKTDQLK